MNAFNRRVLQEDKSGITESCDSCNVLILNWDCIGDKAFFSPNGKILCPRCRELAEKDSHE